MTASLRTRRAVALGAVLSVLLAACSGTTQSAPPASESASGGTGIPAGCPTSQPPALGADETRTLTLATEKGDIVIKVEGSLAPIATGNFVALAECGYYDHVVFHRLVPGFVIQGGDGEYGRDPAIDFNRVGSGGPGYTIKDEPVTSVYRRGTVAMARSSRPDSQGSQFFIVLDDEAGFSLTTSGGGYAVLGQVTSGMDVVDAIAAMPNGGQSTGNLALDPVPFTVTVATP